MRINWVNTQPLFLWYWNIVLRLVNILLIDLSIFVYLFYKGTVHLDFGPLWGGSQILILLELGTGHPQLVIVCPMIWHFVRLVPSHKISKWASVSQLYNLTNWKYTFGKNLFNLVELVSQNLLLVGRAPLWLINHISVIILQKITLLAKNTFNTHW